MTKKQKHKLSPEQAYINTILRVQREEIGFEPTRIHRNKKKYTRKQKHHKPIDDSCK